MGVKARHGAVGGFAAAGNGTDQMFLAQKYWLLAVAAAGPDVVSVHNAPYM
jgi:hypothetical protein